MSRRRTGVLVAAALLGLLPLLVASPAAHGSARGLTHLRLTLDTSSDWATVALTDVDVRVQRTVDLTPGARRYADATTWTVVPGSGPGVLVVEMVVEVPEGADPGIVLRKGRRGTATASIDVVNQADARRAATHVLDSNDPEQNALYAPLDATALGVDALPVGPVDDRQLTLAFYYPWFSDRAPSEAAIGPDKPVAPYSTSDPTAVRAMVDQAAGAGVDGFVVSWSGVRHAGPVDLLLDAVAERPGFVVAPLLELRELSEATLLGGARFDPAVAAAAARRFYERAPAGTVLEVRGRRVLAAFGMWDLSPAQWASFRAQVADLDLFVVGDRRGPAYAIDGFYDYDPNPLSAAQLEQRSDEAIDAARLRPLLDPSVAPLLWAATVSPGFDTRASQRLLASRVTWRDGGRRYDMTWETALRAGPDWVLITSWNEWYEQTHIVAGSRSGRRALDQTAAWTGRFGAGATPAA